MAILDIKKAGDLVLKQQAQPIERIDKTIRTLLDDMAETMYKANGVGLAAPQVGQSIQVVVIDVGEGLLELINPTIIRKEGTEINRRGKRHRITATGLLARCLQHEIDHLHGRLFIDIANNLHKAQK